MNYLVILAFEERYKDTGCQVCKVFYPKLFLGGRSYENPREDQVGGICFRSPTVSRA
jgi:hypothetical protein